MATIEPDKLVGKHIAWSTPKGDMFGIVRATTAQPDVVIAEFGYGKKKDAMRVLVKDIMKVDYKDV